jgi:hypothetical protein
MKIKFLSILMLLVSGVYAQTTDILTHFKSTKIVIINQVKVDNTGRTVIVGVTSNEGVVEFNPNGTSFTYPTTAATTNISNEGFVAAYTSANVLEHFATIGNTGASSSDEINNIVFDASSNIYVMGTFASGIINYYKRYPTNVSAVTLGLGPASGVIKINNDFTTSMANTVLIKATTGNVNDKVNDLKVDATSLYITGRFETANVEFNPRDVGVNSKKLSSAGLGDIFVAKYNLSDLKNVFVYKLGGVNDDKGVSIDFDNSGNLYLTGVYRGTVNMDRTNVATALTEYGGGTTGDMFVAKYNSTFDHQWSFSLGTGQVDEGVKLIIDKSNGDFYSLGNFKKDAVDLELNPLGVSTLVSFSGVFMTVLSKYNTSGILLWNKPIRSSGTGEVKSNDMINLGSEILVAGEYSVYLDAGNSLSNNSLGNDDAFLSTHSSTTGMTNNLYNFGGTGIELCQSVYGVGTKVYLIFNMTDNGDYDPFGSLPVSTHTGTASSLLGVYNLCAKPTIVKQPQPATKCQGDIVGFLVDASSTEPMTYVWKKDNVAISGATLDLYTTFANNVVVEKYKVEITNTCGTTVSDEVDLITQPFILEGEIGDNQTICSGNAPMNFVQKSATTGGSGTYVYQWESSVAPFSTYTAIAGATTTTYQASTLSETTKYRRKESSGVCTSTYSNIVTVTINPAIIAGAVAANQTICSGGNPVAFTQTTAASGGNGTYTYQWEKATASSGPYVDIAGATSSTYDETAALTATTYYRRKDISGVCSIGIGYSNVITVTITPTVTPTVSIVANDNPSCQGEYVNFTATPVSGGTSPVYEWFVNNVSQGAPSTSNGASNDQLSNGDKVTVKMTSNANCASSTPVTSNEITMNITPVTFSSAINGITSVTPNQTNVSFDVPNQSCMIYAWTVPAGASIVSGQGTNSITVNFGATGGIVSVKETKPSSANNTLNLVVSATTGTNTALSNQIQVYPNPITSEAYIQSGLTQSAVVSVCDVNGNVLKTIAVSNLQEPTEFAYSLPKGMYFLKIQIGDQVAMKKIIKE